MIAPLIASVIVLIGLVVALVLRRPRALSVHAPAPVSSAGGWPLPEADVTVGDVDRLRFDTALRGYRMDQVDAAVAALRGALAERDARLQQLGDGPHPRPADPFDGPAGE